MKRQFYKKQTLTGYLNNCKVDAMIVPSLLLGGGAALPAGKGVFIISVSYDVLQHKNAPYGKRPIYNFGYNFSL